MRLLNEQFRDQIIEQVDESKSDLASAMVLFVPEPDRPIFVVYTNRARRNPLNRLRIIIRISLKKSALDSCIPRLT